MVPPPHKGKRPPLPLPPAAPPNPRARGTAFGPHFGCPPTGFRIRGTLFSDPLSPTIFRNKTSLADGFLETQIVAPQACPGEADMGAGIRKKRPIHVSLPLVGRLLCASLKFSKTPYQQWKCFEKRGTSTGGATVARPEGPAHNPLRRIYKKNEPRSSRALRDPLGGSLLKGCMHALVQRPAQELLGALGALGGRLLLNWLRSCGHVNGLVHVHHNAGANKDAPIRGRPPGPSGRPGVLGLAFFISTSSRPTSGRRPRAPRAPWSAWADCPNTSLLAAY